MDVFIHPNALCESNRVGGGTRIGAFAHVLPRATIGRDCDICDHVFVENEVTVGDRVTVKCGVQLWDGVLVEEDVFIGPNVTFTNGAMSRSDRATTATARTLVQAGASIDANATILPGVTIGRNAMIGAGAVVTRSVPPNAIVMGNPARITGYVDAETRTTSALNTSIARQPGKVATSVEGVTLHTLRAVPDMRGNLSVGEFERDVPFKPLRYFLVFDVPTAETRGEHAHHACHQFLVAVRGEVSVVADDGLRREEFRLDNPSIGIYLPPMVWGIQYRYSADAVLMVFASHYYEASDYIRDHAEFLQLKRPHGTSARH